MDITEMTANMSLQDETKLKKREDYIDWQEYFMATAFLAAKRSKDPSYQVGACIVNKDNKIVGVGSYEDLLKKELHRLDLYSQDKHLSPIEEFNTKLKEFNLLTNNTKERTFGYNGMPIGCSDDEFPWAKRTSSPLDSKSLYVCHAEMNAIMNKNSADVKDCTLYVGLFPCNECAKMIIQSGIRKIYYLSDEKGDRPMYIASKRMFDASGVEYKQYVPKRSKIEINFTVDWEAMSPTK